MRAVVQRVNRASLDLVQAESVRTHASIGPGLVVLLGIEAGDTPDDLAWMVRKIEGLRIFEDNEGRMNLALADAAANLPRAPGPGMLIVPNFTVAGRAHKGRRPDFTTAKHPDEASAMFDEVVRTLRAGAAGYTVVSGVFGAHMHVDLVNDGPVTIWLDSEA